MNNMLSSKPLSLIKNIRNKSRRNIAFEARLSLELESQNLKMGRKVANRVLEGILHSELGLRQS